VKIVIIIIFIISAMNKVCKQCNCSFEITEEDLNFYSKIGVVPPTLCPKDRMIRRLSWRNEHSLYYGTCFATNRRIITMYNPEYGFKIYDNDYWWTDNWDPMEYGVDFDFKRLFFEQWYELFKVVPKMARVQQGTNENSKYTNCASYNKNCYLIFTANNNEDCMYGTWVNSSKDSYDCHAVLNSELLYNCIECSDCYNVVHSQLIDKSNDLYHCYDCKYSNNLFACVGLREKSYCILNKKVSKDEFEELLSSKEKQKEVLLKLNDLYFSVPKRYLDIFQSENSTGDHILNCKNVKESFLMVESEDCKYCDSLQKVKDSYDVSFYGSTGSNELLYECEGVGHGVFNTKFSKLCSGVSSNLLYCCECFNCKDCFGCMELKKAQYCIFNKQYTKEEYEELVPKIIEYMSNTGEFGEFFPVHMSPFAYNESAAQDYFPLNKEEIFIRGYDFKEEDSDSQYQGLKYIIPSDIKDVQDDIVNAIFQCEISGKAYKITSQELEFYRKMKLDIPRKCPEQRYKERLSRINPRRLWDRKCMKCSCDIKTTYSPDRKETVYCEDCYNNYIYN